MRSPLRTVALKVHLYLGLTAGLVILILCLTGAALSFETEITRLLHPERYHVAGEGPAVSMTLALDSLHAALPDAKVTSATLSTEPGRPWSFGMGMAGQALVDPYTGHVIATGVRRPAFFQKTMELHRWLLADDLGEQITGGATLMFVVLLCMGLILWWPRTMGMLKARINPFNIFGPHSSGRRKLHDLHVALGIWCWPILLMVALTGLPEAYDWATATIFAVTGSAQPTPAPRSTGDSAAASLPLDSLVTLARSTFPDARLMTVRMPGRPGGAALATAVADSERSDRHIDVAYFDRTSGMLLQLDRYGTTSAGFRARRMVEPWHTGAAWGMPGKILIFLVVLLGASFPVTGFLMYRAAKGHAES